MGNRSFVAMSLAYYYNNTSFKANVKVKEGVFEEVVSIKKIEATYINSDRYKITTKKRELVMNEKDVLWV